VRDGLKPVHRRILYAMYEAGLRPRQAHKKSARIVGDVLGKYHPHGDAAVYDAMVRLAQDFPCAIPLVDGHGNFGSIDGDPPRPCATPRRAGASHRHEMLRDIDKDTVDWQPNYDETAQGAQRAAGALPEPAGQRLRGIAVGMATNIPPHNLGEIIDAIVRSSTTPTITVDDLMRTSRARTFPTGG
jgi:DNA gyrase subunit A